MSKRPLVSALVVLALLTSCTREDPDADVLQGEADAAPSSPAAGTPAQSTSASPPAVAVMPEVVEPVVTDERAIVIGTSVEAGKVRPANRLQFSTRDTVFAQLPGGRHPTGSETKIYWTYQDGMSHKEEKKSLGPEGVVFEFSSADGMKPGRYTVQVDVASVPVGIVDFEVR